MYPRDANALPLWTTGSLLPHALQQHHTLAAVVRHWMNLVLVHVILVVARRLVLFHQPAPGTRAVRFFRSPDSIHGPPVHARYFATCPDASCD